MGDGAQRDDGLQSRHGGQFGRQKRIALANLRCRRLVGGRQAAHRVGDAAVVERHGWIGPVISTQGFRGAGKPETMQRGIEQFAGNVTRKWPPGTICAFFARTKPDHKQLCIQRTESRNWECVPVGIALANDGKVFGKARTGRAVCGVFESGHGRDVSMAAMQLHWDIFCRVIDNYGDIGICWRLARQLVAEQGRHVRLWVDDLGSLKPLCPGIDASLDTQSVEGVEVRHWGSDFSAECSADVVIEAFACELPASYLRLMAEAEAKPCWINLEYLTAESWAEECHGMASPHPTLPLTKYFFFPGFTVNTGGLLRESQLLQTRDRHQQDLQAGSHLQISLFCYDTAPVGALLTALSQLKQPSIVHVPRGKPLSAVMAHLPGNGPWQHGAALIQPVPFMPQDDYDRLLWRSDINFVRGEDSFVRAQWAAKPFVWQIYRQDDDAHLIKLTAFLDRYCAGMSDSQAKAVREMFTEWNIGKGDLSTAIQVFLDNRRAIEEINQAWCRQLASRDDLAAALVNFCASKV